MFRTIELGDRVTWKRFGKDRTGTVVRITRYPWASGASEVLVLSDEDALPTSFHMGIGYELIEGHETMAEAHKRLVDHLSQFPAWKAQFDQGITVGGDWGVYRGFTRVQAAL